MKQREEDVIYIFSRFKGKEMNNYTTPPFGSWQWLCAQAGYQKIKEKLSEDEDVRLALKDLYFTTINETLDAVEAWVEKEYKVDNDNLNKRIEENIKVNGKLIDESAVARMGLMRRLKHKLAGMRKGELE